MTCYGVFLISASFRFVELNKLLTLPNSMLSGHHGGPLWVRVGWFSLQWHNELDDVSNHRRLDCLLNHLFRRRSHKTSKLRMINLCKRNPPVSVGVLTVPYSLIWGYVLHVEHVSCVIPNVWPASGSHLFPFLDSYLALLEETLPENYYPYIMLFKILHFQFASLYSVLSCYFSLLFSGWFVVAVCGLISFY